MWEFYIRSLILSPIFDVYDCEFKVGNLAVNGLINLQCQHIVRDKPTVPSIGIVSSVTNIKTNEVIKHEDY